MGEGRHRRRRADHHVEIFEELQETAIKLALLDLRPGNLTRREGKPAFRVVDHVDVELLAMIVEPVHMGAGKVYSPLDLEDLMGMRKVGLGCTRRRKRTLEDRRSSSETAHGYRYRQVQSRDPR